MKAVTLKKWQYDALQNMKNGCILCGGVGSGKSRTALAYYYTLNGGQVCIEGEANGTLLAPQNGMDTENAPDLYIITTARKRDELDWRSEMAAFLLTDDDSARITDVKVRVDSWNNIEKYKEIQSSFFIFDEQRVVGKGKWVKSFLKIAKNNLWILLSATPGDKWEDYIPVFMANGFFKTRGEFDREHLIYAPYVSFPKVIGYMGTRRLERLRDRILVDMEFNRATIPHHEDIIVEYDKDLYKQVIRERWDPFKNEMIENASGYCYCLRKVINTSEDRIIKVLEILEKHPRAIIFYNFDYELELLKETFCGLISEEFEVSEWNGHKHQPIPDSPKWVYLVQYTAGAEGWNCIKTDTIIFYSQNYSYKILTQSCGRIDRMNTPFKDLYYYHLRSFAGLDLAIKKALKEKKTFNEGRFFDGKSTKK